MSPFRFGDWFFSIESLVASSGELGDDGTSLGYGVRPISYNEKLMIKKGINLKNGGINMSPSNFGGWLATTVVRVTSSGLFDFGSVTKGYGVRLISYYSL